MRHSLTWDIRKLLGNMTLLPVFVALLRANSVLLHPTLAAFYSQIIEFATDPLSVVGSDWPDFDSLGFGVCTELSAGSAEML